MKKILLIAMMVAMATALWAKGPRPGYQTKVVAHRGYWLADGSAQNSIRSLVKADSIGCWGSEFDVWMSKDGTLFVNHDPTIGDVEIQKSKARVVARQRLPNGEPIPTLEQMLKAAVGLPRLQLVCELKPHADKKQEAKAVKKIIDMVAKYGLEKRTTYITFSLEGMKELIKRAPAGTEVYYLNGELTPQQLKELGAAGMDYNSAVVLKHRDWVDQCHQLGLKVNVWTVDDKHAALLDELLDLDIDFITTNTPEPVKQVIFERGISTYP
ncbi:MAG: glycerophosphodiester phosphodiesterase [Muribaculaceae bacterium]|nr:glycerophosphodiester phosphodiesterase [Muribaculaceae bacterium]